MDLTALASQEFEQIQILRDARHAALAIVAIHDTRLGPAFGGIRRFAYSGLDDALDDVLRLAAAMTWKCAISGVPGGGGKAVILQTPGLDREAGYRLVGRFVEEMGGRYYTGPDVGTEPADLEVVAEHTRFVATAGPGGPGNLAVPTAQGVLAGIRAVASRLGRDDLGGVRIALQGLGEVGRRLCELLVRARADVVVADVRRTAVDEAVASLGVRAAAPEGLLDLDVDIYAPCALGGVLDDRGAERLRARAVAGSANNVLATPSAGEILFSRGILYAPDVVITSGALLHGAWFHLDGRPPPPERIESIGDRVGEVIDESRQVGEPPERVAIRRARERVEAAVTGPFLPRAPIERGHRS